MFGPGRQTACQAGGINSDDERDAANSTFRAKNPVRFHLVLTHRVACVCSSAHMGTSWGARSPPIAIQQVAHASSGLPRPSSLATLISRGMKAPTQLAASTSDGQCTTSTRREVATRPVQGTASAIATLSARGQIRATHNAAAVGEAAVLRVCPLGSRTNHRMASSTSPDSSATTSSISLIPSTASVRIPNTANRRFVRRSGPLWPSLPRISTQQRVGANDEQAQFGDAHHDVQRACFIDPSGA